MRLLKFPLSRLQYPTILVKMSNTHRRSEIKPVSISQKFAFKKLPPRRQIQSLGTNTEEKRPTGR